MHATYLLALAATTLASPQQWARADGTTAADKFGWDDLVQEDNFDGNAVDDSWGMYDGEGHDGNGIRTPDAFSVSDGILTVTGTPDGTTGGMAWGQGQQYGRWEVRARYSAGTSAYHCVLLLWPDAENWPVGGEIDFSEVGDGSRQNLDFFLHYGENNDQEQGQAELDMTTWHNYAVEWTEDHIIGYVDAKEFFRSENPDANPPGPMHACIQLDWFPDGNDEGPGKMEVDWIRQYNV